MTEALVGLGLSNLLLSAAIGLVAYGVHRRGRYPALAHLLWVLTLIAAVTPPKTSPRRLAAPSLLSFKSGLR